MTAILMPVEFNVNCLLKIYLEIVMRVLIGVVAALSIALGLAGWRLKVAWEDLAVVTTERDSLKGEVERGEKRFAAFDESIKRLTGATRANEAKLGETISAIRGITKTEGDTDESIQCLDRAVPVQLDRSLRHGK